MQANGVSPERLLILAAYAAANADTPVMRAVAAEAAVDVDFTKIAAFRESPLGGYEVDAGNVTVSVGSEAFMEEMGITPDISQAEAAALCGCKPADTLVVSCSATPSHPAQKKRPATAVGRG